MTTELEAQSEESFVSERCGQGARDELAGVY